MMNPPHAPAWREPGEAEANARPYGANLSALLHRMPHHAARTFTTAQLRLLDSLISQAPPSGGHAIDYRVSLPLFGRRYYLTILAGRERRNTQRLARERQSAWTRVFTAYIVASWLLASVLVALGFIAIYVMKSIAGVDVDKGPSFLHSWFF